ncbi:Acetyltransferase [Thalassocella blandensis]|nr:Acetyltransferase [Thalassocella blandensis]
MVNWQWLTFAELSNDMLYALLKLRQEVFVIEQECLYMDLDDLDQKSWHMLGVSQDDATVLAYARLVPPGMKFAEPSIGRVVASPAARGSGIGKQLMKEAIIAAQQQYPGAAIRISAQQYLQKFYTSLGFKQVSEMYLEDDIPHIEMVRDPAPV